VVIGFNYRFGYKASGDSIYLAQLGEKYGFEVIVLGPVYENGIVVSSTIIRKLIKNARIKEATNLLGKPYTINGVVVDGKKRGTAMGFPTANLKLDSNYLIPKFGVYKTNTIFEGNKYLSITNVGKNPTFEGESISIETHILNFNESIYGRKISVEFIDFVRDEKRFTNKDALKDQVMKDIETVKSN
jgi:riboflavin kinase/FMN adenylyltransferase